MATNGRLSFSIALNLLTDNFKRGASGVTTALRNIQYQALGMAAAFGMGGFGLSEFVSRMIDTARETNRAQIALKNVSGTTKQYAENQKFLISIAQKYGQDLNVLTSNFSKFTASATSAGVSMEDQTKIYESITRATTAFGLSGEEANLTFLAVTQMMAKGKISSEELRRQLGERMPIAMQAMANAAGVNIQALDKMLKQGELYSKDILPKFADELSKMLPNVNTDNVETSVNRMKTAFIQLTESMGVGAKYKAIIDGVARMLKYVQDNFDSVARHVVAVISAVVINKGLRAVVQWLATVEKSAERAATAGLRGAQRTAAAAQFQLNKTKATFLLAARQIGAALKAAFASTVIFAIIGAVVELGYKMAEAVKKGKELASIFKDYQEGAKAANGGEEAERLKELLRIYNDKRSGQEKINGAESELLRMLGLEKGKHQDINKLVKDRIALLEANAKADYYTGQIVSSEDKMRSIVRKYGGIENLRSAAKKEANNKNIFDPKSWSSEATNDYTEYFQYFQVWANAKKQVKSAVGDTLTASPGPQGGDGDGSEKLTPLQKAEKKYAETFDELRNKALARVITEEEYDKALGDLAKTTTEEIGGILGEGAEGNKTFRLAREHLIPELTDYQKEQADYNKKLKDLGTLKEKGILNDKQYQDEVQNLTESTLRAIGSMDGIGAEGDKFIETLKGNLTATIIPKRGQRDTKLDYKKSDADKLSEELELQEKFVDEWKSLNEQTGLFSKQLGDAQANAKTLKEAMDLAQIKEDIDTYNKAVIDGTVSAARAVSSLGKNLEDIWVALGGKKNSGFDKMLNVLEQIMQTYEGLVAISNAVKAITTANSLLSGAKIAADQAEAASAAAKSTTIVAGMAAETLAAKTLMAALSTAAYAGIPGAGVGLAAAQIEAMNTLIAASALPFADGGIVPGTSFSGDKILSRLNSGEMVLNTGQQTRLFSMLKGGNSQPSAARGPVEFKIRGKELVAILNQEYQRNNRT